MYYGKKADPFYKSAHWRRARRMALDRDMWICQDCLAAYKNGEMTAPRGATMVHHIQPRETHPELEVVLTNLVSLCDACHAKRHPEKGGHGEEPLEPPRNVRIIKV